MRGKNTIFMLVDQDRPTTFHWFGNEEGEKYHCIRVDVQLLANHLKGPNVALVVRK